MIGSKFNRICLTLGLLIAPFAAQANCTGENLLTQFAPAERQELEAAANAVPFAQGNLWEARKGEQSITLVGTYHLDDPRHDATMTRLIPLLQKAKTLLVEAGPQEEAALQSALANNPALIVLKDQTLPEVLTAEEWKTLSEALSKRNIPPVMAAKLQPWYVTMLLAIPPCMMANLEQAQNGLDKRVIDYAQTQSLPIEPLEPFDTLFKLFENLTLEQQLAMVRSSLATEPQAEDYLATLAESYFNGESRMIWELTAKMAEDQGDVSPEQAAADLAQMEEVMLTKRNQTWIAVIEAAAARGPVVAAFGALHLSGQTGIAQLLSENGWQLTALQP